MFAKNLAQQDWLCIYVGPTTTDMRERLPRPQASLLGRARCALGYGIESARFARRFGIDAKEKSNHHPSRPLFSRHTAFYRTAPGDEAARAAHVWCTIVDCVLVISSIKLKWQQLSQSLFLRQILLSFCRIFVHRPDAISLQFLGCCFSFLNCSAVLFIARHKLTVLMHLNALFAVLFHPGVPEQGFGLLTQVNKSTLGFLQEGTFVWGNNENIVLRQLVAQY